MSWKDKIENSKFSIKTGDNKEFFPLTKIGSKSKEFNTSIFDFIDIEGSFVDRRKAKSSKYDFTFYFQGDNHIEDSEAFEISSNDSKFWTVEHPIFGTIKGQPVNLTRNESNLGITEFSVEFWETIEGGYLKKKESVLDKNLDLQNKLFEKNSNSLLNADLKAIDQKNSKSLIDQINSRIEKVLSDEFYNDYQEIFSDALNSVDNIILKPVDTISKINRLIDIPNDFKQSVEFRGKLMNHIWNDIKDIFGKVFSFNDNSFIESLGAAVVASLSVACLKPLENDYITSKNTLNAAFTLNSLFTDYLNLIDVLQKKSNGNNKPFVLNFETQFLLKQMVSSTIFNLFSVAFEAKQERNIYLERDSNLILITHKYFGLDSEDKNLELVRQINGIKNNSLFKIKKGTKITYFV